MRPVAILFAAAVFAPACGDDSHPSSSGGAGGAGGESFGGSGFGGSGACTCASGIHETNIIVLSADGALWRFDPVTKEFAFVRDLPCGIDNPYSMAVDADGKAWVLDIDSKYLVTVDLEGSGGCGDPGYVPGPFQSGFELFGMAFSTRGPGDLCADLYAESYSGQGPFGEGPGAGMLGRLDPETVRFSVLSTIDYDGGELAGTSEGRLFSFAGVDPVKLVEYDRETGETLATLPLEGFDKTRASAFALFGGSVYFFTEAPPVGCDACLDEHCSAAHQACLADPACAADLACVLGTGDFTDACGGSIGAELTDCVVSPCSMDCLPPIEDRKSKVSRLDLADPVAGVSLDVPLAPIRIVGAGTSICAPAVAK